MGTDDATSEPCGDDEVPKKPDISIFTASYLLEPEFIYAKASKKELGELYEVLQRMATDTHSFIDMKAIIAPQPQPYPSPNPT